MKWQDVTGQINAQNENKVTYMAYRDRTPHTPPALHPHYPYQTLIPIVIHSATPSFPFHNSIHLVLHTELGQMQLNSSLHNFEMLILIYRSNFKLFADRKTFQITISTSEQ